MNEEAAEALTFEVGDHLIKAGRVYEVFEITEREGEDGETERIIHYKPKFIFKRNQSLRCSIPEKNVGLMDTRKPATKAEIEEHLATLDQPPEKTTALKKNEVHANWNDLEKVMEYLRRIWDRKIQEDRNFTYSKRRMFNRLMRHLSEEIAVVFDMEYEEAEEKILEALRKRNPEVGYEEYHDKAA
jgi:RNA polymerase-interacting CarD/CdnL/TRCF family regulator